VAEPARHGLPQIARGEGIGAGGCGLELLDAGADGADAVDGREGVAQSFEISGLEPDGELIERRQRFDSLTQRLLETQSAGGDGEVAGAQIGDGQCGHGLPIWPDGAALSMTPSGRGAQPLSAA